MALGWKDLPLASLVLGLVSVDFVSMGFLPMFCPIGARQIFADRFAIRAALQKNASGAVVTIHSSALVEVIMRSPTIELLNKNYTTFAGECKFFSPTLKLQPLNYFQQLLRHDIECRICIDYSARHQRKKFLILFLCSCKKIYSSSINVIYLVFL